MLAQRVAGSGWTWASMRWPGLGPAPRRTLLLSLRSGGALRAGPAGACVGTPAVRRHAAPCGHARPLTGRFPSLQPAPSGWAGPRPGPVCGRGAGLGRLSPRNHSACLRIRCQHRIRFGPRPRQGPAPRRRLLGLGARRGTPRWCRGRRCGGGTGWHAAPRRGGLAASRRGPRPGPLGCPRSLCFAWHRAAASRRRAHCLHRVRGCLATR